MRRRARGASRADTLHERGADSPLTALHPGRKRTIDEHDPSMPELSVPEQDRGPMDVPRRGLGTLTLALWYVVAMVVHGIPWPFVLGVVAMLASGCEESTLGLLTKDSGTAVAQDAQPADATEFVLDAHLSTDADAQDVDRFDVNPFDVLASDVAPPDASIEDATALDADPRDAGADDAESEDGRPSDVGATDARPSDAETWDAVASDATGLDGSTTPADGGTPPDQACAVGSRTGFRELAIFPDVAACGPRVSYDVAMAAAPISCGVDFHPCSYTTIRAWPRSQGRPRRSTRSHGCLSKRPHVVSRTPSSPTQRAALLSPSQPISSAPVVARTAVRVGKGIG
jgi:hypothetical protein